VRAAQVGWITASGRGSADNPSFFVFDRATVAAAPGESVVPGTYALGRPWRDYARVVFQHSVLPDLIKPAGWDVWGPTEPNTDHVEFGEFGNTGAGTTGPRANFSSLRTAPVAIADVLGADYTTWVDGAYL
jgi:pectinesterase